MTNNLYIYIIVLSLFIVISCKKAAPTPKIEMTTDQVLVQISKGAGDLWKEGEQFLVMPFNLANYKGNEMLILGQRMDSNSAVVVNPLGAITTLENDSLKTYILATPRDAIYQTIDCKDFDEFSTVYSSTKWIIEQYIINHRGPNTSRLQSWEDDQFAINFLIR